MKCRGCNSPAELVFADLVNSPPSNSYLTTQQLNEPESYFPLKVYVCESCWLVQVDEYKKSEAIFDKDYAYFSSVSSSWVAHAQSYVEMISNRLNLNSNSKVMEIASNDGYLLQFFQQKQIPCIGVEPTASTATAAKAKGLNILEEFFGASFAQEQLPKIGKQDLILGNNVLAHVPDINDFVAGLKVMLASDGTITMEFPHLLNLIKYNQFDTIYHEHFSYLSLFTVKKIFEAQGLDIYDVEELETHGGSLRIYATHKNSFIEKRLTVDRVLKLEESYGLQKRNVYQSFQAKVDKVKMEFLTFLLEAKKAGKRVAAYGAAAKGNTLLNYCGIKNDLIEYVVDAAESKQGKYLPGSHIPIVEERVLRMARPDYIILLPWNIKEELELQLSYTREWDALFVTAIPELKVY